MTNQNEAMSVDDPSSVSFLGASACSLLSVVWVEHFLGFAYVDAAHVVHCGQRSARIPHATQVCALQDEPHGESTADLTAQQQQQQVDPSTALDDDEIRELTQLVHALKPERVQIPSRHNKLLLTTLQRLSQPVTFIAPTQLTVEKCREMLAYMWPNASAVSWTAKVDTTQIAAMCALGGCLASIIKTGQLVSDVTHSAFPSLVLVDVETLCDLEVFRSDEHPSSLLNAHLGPKEGFSISGMLLRTKSALGRLMMREWFLTPTNDEKILHSRHNLVQFFVEQENQLVLREVRHLCRFIGRPDLISTKFLSMAHGTSDYENLGRMCSGLIRLYQIFQEHASALSSYQLVEEFMAAVQEPSLRQIVDVIQRTIDFSASQRHEQSERLSRSAPPTRVSIRRGISAELDAFRDTYANYDQFLTEIARREAERLPATFPVIPIQVSFFPQLGYLLAISKTSFQLHDAAAQQPSSDIIHPLPSELIQSPEMQWEFSFHNENCWYYKTPLCRELDDSVGDVYGRVTSLTLEEQRHLDEKIIQLMPCLGVARLVAPIDCCAAFASCAVEENWCRPTICGGTDRFHIAFRGAFHPLLSRAGCTPVPFDFQIGQEGNSTPQGDLPRTIVVTGPNGSGKSVFLRTVALIAYLAHIGSFVPATSATVGPIDHVLTLRSSAVINAPSMAKASKLHWSLPNELRSTFVEELASLGRMLRCATPKSLLLLDEFGKGTSSVDGVALLGAALQTLSQPNIAPIVLCTTHFSEVLSSDILPRGAVLHYTMKYVQVNPPTAEDACEAGDAAAVARPEKILTFLYLPVLGSEEGPLQSRALDCAQAFGVPNMIVDRAREVERCLRSGDYKALGVGKYYQYLVEAEVPTVLALFLEANLEDENQLKNFRSELNRVSRLLKLHEP